MAGPVDVTQSVAALGETISALVAVGGAVLLLLVTLRTLQWLRKAVDEDGVPEHPDAHDVFVDDWSDFDPDNDIITDEIEFQCAHCGWEAEADDAIDVYQNEACTKCGEGL